MNKYLSLLIVPLITLQILGSSAIAETTLNFSSIAEKKKYQLGDEWGKKKVDRPSLSKESPVFVRFAKATARLPIGGTGFYLGKFAGKHVLATNYHVCSEAKDCVGDRAYFPMLKKNFKMKKIILSSSDIDLALVEIDVPKKHEELLAGVAKNFAFNTDTYKGQELLTIGFGFATNKRMNLMANQDADCKVFSDDGEYRYLLDPDKINPGKYHAWSFAHGCDISHGDSGSAVVDRATGEIVGILWTGKLPKSDHVQVSSTLNQIFDDSSEDVWTELSYAVPSVKIRDYIQNHLQEGHEETSEFHDVLESLLVN